MSICSSRPRSGPLVVTLGEAALERRMLRLSRLPADRITKVSAGCTGRTHNETPRRSRKTLRADRRFAIERSSPTSGSDRPRSRRVVHLGQNVGGCHSDPILGARKRSR